MCVMCATLRGMLVQLSKSHACYNSKIPVTFYFILRHLYWTDPYTVLTSCTLIHYQWKSKNGSYLTKIVLGLPKRLLWPIFSLRMVF